MKVTPSGGRSTGNRGKPTKVRPKAVVVGLVREGQPAEQAREDLAELRRLAEDAGADVVDTVIQVRRAPHPSFYVGRGKVREIQERVRQRGAELVIFDDSLKPSQVRNLEDLLEVKILDRVQLILDIFARRARSREGQLQVELAQYQYLLPRLTGKGVELSRLGGGIGTRGPGETLLEVKQREIKRRIRRIRRQLQEIQTQRKAQKARRSEAQLPVFALVGYTNAGKTTLFNRLTGGRAAERDQLFTTLEPRVRRMRLGELGEVLISDTVGFIRKLPPWLVAAFRATLDEVYGAFALIHIMDATSPRLEEEIEAVDRVLDEMGVRDKPILRVLNKMDRVRDLEQGWGWRIVPTDAIPVSAVHGEGLDTLIEAMADLLRTQRETLHLLIPYDAMDRLSDLYQVGRIFYRSDRPDGVYLIVEVPQWLVPPYTRFLTDATIPEPTASVGSGSSG